jgi:hypothetical protein
LNDNFCFFYTAMNFKVRPPQAPAPPPLFVRIQPPPPAEQAPIVIREAPPPRPKHIPVTIIFSFAAQKSIVSLF